MASSNLSRDTRTPAFPLSPAGLAKLKKIFVYTRVIKALLESQQLEKTDAQEKQRELLEKIKKSRSLQHALIFCLKAIGSIVDQAAILCHIDLSKDEAPLFWRNLHHLRNSLVHSCPIVSIPAEMQTHLSTITVKAFQIYNYFSLVCDAQNTKVDLGGEKFGVFIDIHALAEVLKTNYSREVIAKRSQQQHLQVILEAIEGIANIGKETQFTEETMQDLQVNNPQRFYTLQNLLEIISTIANPNPGAAPGEKTILTEETRKALIHHSQVDTWLGELGDARAAAMHGSSEIPLDELGGHLENMVLLKAILLTPQFQSAAHVRLLSSAGSSAPQPSQVPPLSPAPKPSEQKEEKKRSAVAIKPSTGSFSSAPELFQGSSLNPTSKPPEQKEEKKHSTPATKPPGSGSTEERKPPGLGKKK